MTRLAIQTQTLLMITLTYHSYGDAVCELHETITISSNSLNTVVTPLLSAA
jgi:hypothetical protein